MVTSWPKRFLSAKDRHLQLFRLPPFFLFGAINKLLSLASALLMITSIPGNIKTTALVMRYIFFIWRQMARRPTRRSCNWALHIIASVKVKTALQESVDLTAYKFKTCVKHPDAKWLESTSFYWSERGFQQRRKKKSQLLKTGWDGALFERSCRAQGVMAVCFYLCFTDRLPFLFLTVSHCN